MKSAPLLLLAPLTLTAIGFAQSAPQSNSPPPAWQPSQQTDAARSFTFTRFTLPGTFVAPPQGPVANRPALAVDCIPAKGSDAPKGKLLAANLVVGTNLKILYVEPEEIHGMSYLQKVAVRYRADDANEQSEKWSPGTDKSSASIPKDSLKKILRAHRVAVTADDDRGSQVAMQFDLPDAAQIDASCNVNER